MGDVESANGLFLAEVQNVFATLARHPGLHQARRPFRDDDLVMRRDMIAVRVRDEGKRLRIPGVEPDVFVRQINAAFVSHFDHPGNLRGYVRFDISRLFPFA